MAENVDSFGELLRRLVTVAEHCQKDPASLQCDEKELERSKAAAIGTVSRGVAPIDAEESPETEPETMEVINEKLAELAADDTAQLQECVQALQATLNESAKKMSDESVPLHFLTQAATRSVIPPLQAFSNTTKSSRESDEKYKAVLQQQKTLQDERTTSATTMKTKTRKDRHAEKVRLHKMEEEFFESALKTLEETTGEDRAILRLSEAEDTRLCDTTSLEALHKKATGNVQHLTTTRPMYEQTSEQLGEKIATTSQEYQKTLDDLQRSIESTITIMDTFCVLRKELHDLSHQRAVQQNIERAAEQWCDEEKAKQEQTRDEFAKQLRVIEGIKVELQPHTQAIKEKFTTIKDSTNQHYKEHAQLYASVWNDYYNHLQHLVTGKTTCLSLAKRSLDRVADERERWEALEHEAEAQDRLEDLDKQEKDIQEHVAQLEAGRNELQEKVNELEKRGSEILPTVADWVHPKRSASEDPTQHLFPAPSSPAPHSPQHLNFQSPSPAASPGQAFPPSDVVYHLAPHQTVDEVISVGVDSVASSFIAPSSTLIAQCRRHLLRKRKGPGAGGKRKLARV